MGSRTFDGVAKGVHAEGDGDEESENLFGGPGGPTHEPGNVKERVENEEEGGPEAHAAVHGVEIQLEILADAINHYDDKSQKEIRTIET